MTIDPASGAAPRLSLARVLLCGAAVVTLVTVLPRWSVGLSWLLLVFSVFVGPMFGPSLGLPTWLLNLSPFTHVPNAPAVAISYEPILGLVLACVLLGALGVIALRRRNLLLPA